MQTNLNNRNTNNKSVNNQSYQQNHINKVISETEMQELVADYLFETLTNYEKEVFEANVHLYPKIQNEIKEFRTAFEEVDKFTFEEDLLNRSRNLSYKVQKRLDEQKRTRGFFSTVRFLAPALSLLLIIVIAKYFVSNKTLDNVMVYLNIKDKTNIENYDNNYITKLNSEPIKLLKDSDIALLQNEISDEELIDYSLSFDNSLDVIDNYSNIFYISNIINQTNQSQYSNSINNSSNFTYNLDNELDMIELAELTSNSYNLINFNNTLAELDEEDLQIILNTKF